MRQNVKVIFVAAGGRRCGLTPGDVYLKRGQRTQLVFWTDQNYGDGQENNQIVDADDSFLQVRVPLSPFSQTKSNKVLLILGCKRCHSTFSNRGRFRSTRVLSSVPRISHA